MEKFLFIDTICVRYHTSGELRAQKSPRGEGWGITFYSINLLIEMSTSINAKMM